MITNNEIYDVLGQIPHEHRSKIKYRRNPRWFHRSERDFMFRELPQNPLRIVEYASEVAKESLLWDDVEWGMDDKSCWIKQRFNSQRDKNYFELIEKEHPRYEAEVFAALRLLSSVLKDRNI